MPRTRKQSVATRSRLVRNRVQELRIVEIDNEPIRRVQNNNLQRRTYNSTWRSRRRQDLQFREQERSRDATDHLRRREDPEYRAAEQGCNTAAHSQRREDHEYRAAEQERDTVAHSQRREDPEYRAAEQECNTAAHSQRRDDPEYRSAEQVRDTAAHSQRRDNIEYRIGERLRNTAQRQSRRAAERSAQQDLSHSRNLRVIRHRRNPINRTRENIRQSQRNRVTRASQTNEERQEESAAVVNRRNDLRFQRYNDTIKQGPTCVCTCCGGLWFPHQVETLKKQGTSNLNFISEVFYLSDKFPSPDDMYNFCKTCSRSIKNGRKPNICLSNGLDFPEIPSSLKDLTSVEERLITARLPFMVIVSLGFERQSAIRGAVVNVPISVSETVTALPRTFDQAYVIQLHLRRRMEYQHDYMTETIRPAKVIEAARYLINTELYVKHGITIADGWFESFNSQNIVPFVANQQDQEAIQAIFDNQMDSEVNNANGISDIDEFAVENLNPGGQQTLLENIPAENIPQQRVVMAPGEGHRPVDMLMDIDSEELAFATIYCGKKRPCTETYSKIIRSELRRYDRRCCRIDKLLYSYKKLELLTIKSATSIALRKHTRSRSVTAGNALNDAYVNDLIQHDDGYRILKGVRSSPAHWEAEKKKAIAMIRQFGLPTFFITLSAAETKWLELLVILSKTVDNVVITEEGASNLPFSEKARLIRSDAVTCSRYFDFRFRQLFSLFKMNNGIFDNHFVEKYYWRVEFQQRGSPHIHGMYWLKDAPKIDLNNPSTFPGVINFIDTYVSTNGADDNLSQYLQYQRHNHNRSCTREFRGEKICRYGMPYPPMPSTEILMPLPDNFENVEQYKGNYDKIQSLLTANISAEEISHLNDFENFLAHENINLSYDDYVLSLRSVLKKPKILLRRRFEDKMLNAYNPTILELHRANMDIQFILDPYACCSYIINYINKSNRGVSRILRDAVEEIRTGNYSIKQKLQHIAYKFISGTEISAQEATYCCLGMRLSESSNAEVYINTGRPEERVFILRPREQLQNLPPDSTDIYAVGTLDHYIQRPDELENLCLADFAANYKFSKTLRARNSEENYEEQENEEEVERSARTFRLKDNSGFIKEKIKPHVIRYRRYNVNTHRSDYFRELVMLYHPWRNEETDLLHNDNETTCTIQMESIESNRKRYDVFEERELENVLERLREENVAVNVTNEEDNTNVIDDEFRVLAVPEIDPNINILHTQGTVASEESSNGSIRIIKLPPLISEPELLNMVRTLNGKQKLYLTHLHHNIKCGATFHEFIGGGAGVGKSRLISCIYQSVNHRLNSIPGSDPNLIKVLLTAPTGKAAFGIGGATLHSMFSLPINQSAAEIRPLGPDTINSMFAKLMNLKLLIIDEISMVGAKMFSYLDARLKQIFKSTDHFGGISVIVFGDLNQLSPVGDRWIFSPPSNNPYSVIYGSSIWDKFKYFELTEIMRQREDQSFAMALNNMASGQMTNDDISLIRQRIVSPSEVPGEAIHLFCSNDEVNNFNESKLSSIPTEEVISIAQDIVKSTGLTDDNRARILEVVKSFKVSETQGLPHRLILKTSAKYMVTVNIDTSDGLVNGATGQLMQIDFSAGTTNPSILWIQFPESTVGVLARSKKRHPIESSWTPLGIVVKTFQFKRNDQVNIDRKQFPIVPAEGITIHKSQGATYENVAVHLKPRMNRSALYVACSRATKAAGLFLLGSFNPPKPFSPNDVVHMEMTNLRSHKILKTHFDHVFDASTLKIVYQNVQSLHAHIEDVRNDKLMLQADILCFVETWTLNHENYAIPGFTVMPAMRLDSTHERNHRCKRGIIVFVKNEIRSFVQYHYHKQVHVHNKTLEFLVFKVRNTNILVLYRNKNYAEGPLHIELNRLFSENTYLSENAIIVGDFNICRRRGKPETEVRLNNKGYSSILETETTKGLTKIDWCFTNIDRSIINAVTFETVYSYHDAICISISN